MPTIIGPRTLKRLTRPSVGPRYQLMDRAPVPMPSNSLAGRRDFDDLGREGIEHPSGVWFPEPCFEITVNSDKYDQSITILHFDGKPQFELDDADYKIKTTHDMPEKKRNLNMEEKRQLEKIIFSDIDTAGRKYDADRKREREKLQERLLEKAPANVVALFTECTAAARTIARVEKELLELGYMISGYGENRALAISYNKLPAELIAFDTETSRNDKRIDALKRDYTLRLFAGGEEARELFATLAGEIAKLI